MKKRRVCMLGQKVYGKSLCLPFNFAVNVKFQEIKSIFENSPQRETNRKCMGALK